MLQEIDEISDRAISLSYLLAFLLITVADDYAVYIRFLFLNWKYFALNSLNDLI